ncbi:MAG: type II secretion system F family protein [Magnetospirillum sp.]|nr:type II secretion system F family protein [Magnetospirillum sp.]
MGEWRWRAVDESGEVAEGAMEAESADAVVAVLRRQGRLVLDVRPGAGPGLLSRPLFVRNRLSERAVALLFRELATLLHAGLPLDRALDVMAELAGPTAAGRVCAALVGRVRGGSSLADAMEAEGDAFRRFAIGMVRAGEAAGALEVVTARLADFMERSVELREGLVSAMLYPLLLLAASVAAVTMMLTVVLPQFRPLFEQAGARLPLATQMVLAAGDAVEAAWWLLPAAVVAAAMVVVRRRTDAAFRLALDRRLLAVPLFGRLTAELEVARLLKGLGTLLANGVPILAGLAILEGTAGNAAVAAAMAAAVDSLRHGRGFTEKLAAETWFPRVAVHLLAVGEETGHLDEMVGRAADILDSRARRTLDRGLALLGPVMTMVLGLLVAGVIAAILLAVLSVNDLAI